MSKLMMAPPRKARVAVPKMPDIFRCQAKVKLKDPAGVEHEERCTRQAKVVWHPTDKAAAMLSLCGICWDAKLAEEVSLQHSAYLKKKRLLELAEGRAP
jgi:hypothetical protein